MSVQCFMIERAPMVRESLRRFVWSEKEKCPGVARGMSYHNAFVPLRDQDWPVESSCGDTKSIGAPVIAKDDPRWPKTCAACAYVFTDDDPWQHQYERYWKRADGTGTELWTMHNVPPGAMWDAWWWPDEHRASRPDGMVLCVQLPNGRYWMIDGPASNGTPGEIGWTRTGVAPKITATPSILAGDYHGWLRDGVLVPC